jgi:hypothetical protein
MGFTFTLGYSRAMMAEAALDQKLGTLLRMHEEAFRRLGGVPIVTSEAFVASAIQEGNPPMVPSGNSQKMYSPRGNFTLR